MDVVFKLVKRGEFGLLVEGLESDSNQYLQEDDVRISHRAYRWSDSATVNFLIYVNSEGLEEIKKYAVEDHEVCCLDQHTFELDKDGLYKVARFIIPTREWVEAYLDSDPVNILYDKIHYINESGKLCYWEDNKFYEDFEISSLLDIEITSRTTILRGDKNTFAIYHLNKCFNTLVKDLLYKLRGTGNCSNSEIEALQMDRDIVWMFLNAIKYALELGRLFEAQRLLEQLNTCNTICTNTKPTKRKNGCGC